MAVLVFAGMMPAMSQDVSQDTIPAMQEVDSTFIAPPLIVPEMDTIATSVVITDSVPAKKKRDWNTWRPNPKRAMWLAIVLPGAGQIYNRKYWKLPIFYGGFVGCLYALSWNGQMYHDYSQAYVDLMDNDPNTQRYNDFCTSARPSTRAIRRIIRRYSASEKTVTASGAT